MSWWWIDGLRDADVQRPHSCKDSGENYVATIKEFCVPIMKLNSGRQPRNKEELKNKIFQAVYEMNDEKRDVSRNLYSTSRERLTKVLVRKGNLYNAS